MKKTSRQIYAKLLFILSGITATAWFLFRVIPKPSRATYPCMRATYPIMSGFVVYLLGLTGSMLFLKKARQKLVQYKYLSAAGLFMAALAFYAVFTYQSSEPALAKSSLLLESNMPVGSAKGVNPGRVTWFYDKDATNENLDVNSKSNSHHLPSNTNQDVVQEMMDKSIVSLIGVNLTDVDIAWDSLFCYFNRNHGKGNVTYRSGEKIFIKANIVGQWGVNNNFDIGTGNYNTAHTSPISIKAILKHLIEYVGVAEPDISVGDPIQPMPKEYFNYLSGFYPGVKYICNRGGSGHTKAEKGVKTDIYFSDRGNILREGDPDSWGNSQWGDSVKVDTLYRVIEEADYMINMSAMKGHERAGISLCAKNHFGSHTRTYAKQLHMGLVHPNQKPDDYSRDTYKQYRVLVDLMGHEKLGGNTLLFIVDGLYSSTGAGDKVVKWKSAGFNNDWTSSIFMSQDPVAIESVAFDFLKEEYRALYHNKTTPQYTAVEDYLLQAADASYWPENIVYDPENDGIALKSLGVYESWNNPADRQYSRNLGIGSGIELVKVHALALNNKALSRENLISIYPQPVNQASVLRVDAAGSARMNIAVYDMSGRLLNTTEQVLDGSMQISIADLINLDKLHNQFVIMNIQIQSGNKESAYQRKIFIK